MATRLETEAAAEAMIMTPINYDILRIPPSFPFCVGSYTLGMAELPALKRGRKHFLTCVYNINLPTFTEGLLFMTNKNVEYLGGGWRLRVS